MVLWIFVSVPSRGLRYLNLPSDNDEQLPIVVSVPSRGLRYLNDFEDTLRQLKVCFRPLTGIKVSELNQLYLR